MDGLPDDCRALLAAAHRRTGSLRETGDLIGYSASAVSLLLKGTYPARNLGRVTEAIRANLGDGRVSCPAFDGAEIELARCLSLRGRPLSAASDASVRLYRACRACPRAADGTGDRR